MPKVKTNIDAARAECYARVARDLECGRLGIVASLSERLGISRTQAARPVETVIRYAQRAAARNRMRAGWCPECRGRGHDGHPFGALPCERCGGTGSREAYEAIEASADPRSRG